MDKTPINYDVSIQDLYLADYSMSKFKSLCREYVNNQFEEIGVVTKVFTRVTHQEVLDFFNDFFKACEFNADAQANLIIADKIDYVVYQYLLASFTNNGELYYKYLTVINGLNGKLSLQFRVMLKRFVCSNQLPVFNQTIKWKHSSLIFAKVEELSELNTITKNFSVDFTPYYDEKIKEDIKSKLNVILFHLTDTPYETVPKILDTDGNPVYVVDISKVSTKKFNIISRLRGTLHNGLGQNKKDIYTLFWLMNGVSLFIRQDYSHEFLELENNPIQKKLAAIIDAYINKKQTFKV